ncbi:cyclin-dependent kinase inhibitor 1 [Pogoniulus pusillus]
MPLSQSRAGQMPCSSKVCRNLFGPVDHQELLNDLQGMMRQHLEEAQQRWNFNFETETPLEGQFKWERVFQDEQEVHSLVSAISEDRSSRVPPKDHPGRICPEGAEQSLGVYKAASPHGLKRGQATIKDFYSSKRRLVPEKPKPDKPKP